MKKVEEFTNLGSVMINIGKLTQDHEERRAAATRAFGTLKCRLGGRGEVSLKMKKKIFNVVVLPVLLCIANAWALTRAEERTLDAFDVGMLRSIAGVRWDDFV